MPDFLDLPAPVIEQIAKVRLDEGIDFEEECPKRFCFWVLREVGHRGVYAAAWEARHSVGGKAVECGHSGRHGVVPCAAGLGRRCSR